SSETRIRKSIEFSESLRFPAVTICNQNMLKKSKIQGTQAQDYLDQLDDLKFSVAGLKNSNVPPFDIEKVVQESGHHIHEMVNQCQFTDQVCSLKNFTPAATMSFFHGNCYTFNAGDNGSSILRVRASGKMQSLTLRLDSEPHEYYGPFSYDATGFKIAVHNQGNHLDIEEEGYDISPGFYTSIRIKKNKVRR
ncbi:acid-sensing ion channel 3-like, partial [Actinia tenebrosa]|uniref:Acid-sensing ion channel 3-like n=1 Tax=Actinia tenebrosa TaxID=6105 RepID=A0A6P8IAL5_ACTTE